MRRTTVRPTKTSFRAPPLPRAEQPWVPPYQYVCSKGHELGADREVCCCPMCPGGVPCDGELVRFGKGART